MFDLLRENNRDELTRYQAGRYLSRKEAFWLPAVQLRAIHLKKDQRVYFTNVNAIQMSQQPGETSFTISFKLCQVEHFARTLLCLTILGIGIPGLKEDRPRCRKRSWRET